jgi:guanosine-3',5'-bis(diphosphate) 3'-pyrophosphohydrolase
MALPRGATVVDFAYAIHSNVGDRTTAAKINNEQVPLRTELKNGDVVEIITAPVSTPNPAWLASCAPGARAPRSATTSRRWPGRVRKAWAKNCSSRRFAQKAWRSCPPDDAEISPLGKAAALHWQPQPPRMLTDIGLGKRIASIVAKRLVVLLGEHGQKSRCLLLTRERYTSTRNLSQGAVTLDGSRKRFGAICTCCRPVPGDRIVGYLGRGEGLVVHNADCSVAKRLQHKDSERFIAVDWADEPDTPVRNRRGCDRDQRQGRTGTGRPGVGQLRSGHHPCGHG